MINNYTWLGIQGSQPPPRNIPSGMTQPCNSDIGAIRPPASFGLHGPSCPVCCGVLKADEFGLLWEPPPWGSDIAETVENLSWPPLPYGEEGFVDSSFFFSGTSAGSSDLNPDKPGWPRTVLLFAAVRGSVGGGGE